jgi:hypothetical protein
LSYKNSFDKNTENDAYDDVEIVTLALIKISCVKNVSFLVIILKCIINKTTLMLESSHP